MLEFNVSKFKQELPVIVFLSATQIMLAFWLPGYRNKEGILPFLSSLIISLMSVYIYILGFSSADKFKFYIDFEGFNTLPNASLYAKNAKKITKTILLLIAMIIMLHLWRIDFYHASNTYYVFLYSHMITSILFFYKAAHRKAI